MSNLLQTSTFLFTLLNLAVIIAVNVYQRRSRKVLRNLHREMERHVWSTAALHNGIVPTAMPLPPPGDFRLSSDLLAYISAKIINDELKLVVELGSGLSTIILGAALKKVGGRLISIESGIEYLNTTQKLIQNADLGDVVTLVHAPIKPFDDHYRWYDTNAFPVLRDVDMLLIDGPPGNTCAKARFPALPFLWDKLKDDAFAVLDDAGRPDEIASLNQWQEIIPDITVERLPLSHHPVLIRRKTERHDINLNNE
jgi:predicted O-methyltransferase YrrM